ncbi:MAG: hypothetical protein CMP21_08835 [Rickettsiales bacterium]|nr:hypothetical protein [Rickettsiales bacterium]|tara:strand:- start:466 stop:684 length:219 start_codon:yes stop_codon:yes gene_type:complete
MKTFASLKDVKKRLSICKECEFLFKPTKTCKKCGCFMKIKARMSNVSCPIGKWDEVESVPLKDIINQLEEKK